MSNIICKCKRIASPNLILCETAFYLFLVTYLTFFFPFHFTCRLVTLQVYGSYLSFFPSLQLVSLRWGGVVLELTNGGEMNSFGLLVVFQLIFLLCSKVYSKYLLELTQTSLLPQKLQMKMETLRNYTCLNGQHFSFHRQLFSL